ncbi:hypothetical protein DFO66_103317 [Brevibacterium sanguinis]|uniref:Uncharacterized protein n=2 Tax=Brevibacterium TaxID=1696 RepID=A0A366IMC6_9MICO|nr:hypothetical protein DFO66_103317 [Brevibacterium sanguinis]RBP73021.1 hypothetical protein DFO65_103316 [Brevibacterium celere]
MSTQQARRALRDALDARDSIARRIANDLADGRDVDPLRVQMYREAVEAVTKADAALASRSKKETT